MRLIFVLMILLAPVSIAAQETTAQARQMRRQAAEAFNSGRLQEARSLLEKLIQQYPGYVPAYNIYWEAVGRTEDAATRRTVVERNAKQLALTPEQKRDEEFYAALVHAYEILEDGARAASLKKEAVARFPRGILAQSALLDAARDEKDPVKSAAAYQAYIEKYSNNTSWSELAARSKFIIVAGQPGSFPKTELLAAAEQYEKHTRRFVQEYGNTYRLVDSLSTISDAIKATAPVESLKFAQKGLSYIQETWPNTDEFNESKRFLFWPAMLRAYNRLKTWKSARKVGEALIKEVDSGSLSKERIMQDEAQIRSDYSLALEQTGAIDKAREQLALAAALDNELKPELAAFTARHPMSATEQSGFEASVAAKTKEVSRRRDDYVRNSILAAEQKQPARAFRLKDAAGKLISLSDFRGKTVVLDFWATWCAPCIAELEELKVFYGKYKSDPRVAVVLINLDADKDLAIKHAKEHGYTFPILFSDGTVENSYKTQSIPQLYIIDPSGNIRFHQAGNKKDGYFLKTLDWMIEAVLQ